MIYKVTPFVLALSLFATSPSWGQDAPSSGVLMASSGDVFRVTINPDGGEVLTPITPGDPVFSGDEIRTSDGAEVQVMMRDQSVFSMGSQSSLQINQFNFTPDGNDNRFDLKINTGDVKILSGRIGAADNKLTVNIADAVVNLSGGEVAASSNGAKTDLVLLSGRANIRRNQISREIFKSGWGITLDENGDISTPEKFENTDLTKKISAFSKSFKRKQQNDNNDQSQVPTSNNQASNNQATGGQQGTPPQTRSFDGLVLTSLTARAEAAPALA